MSKEKELPRMVEVRYHSYGPWAKRELIADLSHVKNLRKPFVCWNNKEAGETHAWPMMREIKELMTFAQFFNGNSGAQVSRGLLQSMYDAYQSYLSEFNQE